MSKRKKSNTARADTIRVGDVLEVRGMAATVARAYVHDTVVALWWRADGDDPSLAPHRCTTPFGDEQVTVIRRADQENPNE